MLRPRIISHVVVSVVLLGLAAGTSCAALLAEIGINVDPMFDGSPPAGDSLQFSFDVSSRVSPPAAGQFRRAVVASDIGSTFEASPEIVQSLAQALTRPTADVGVTVHEIQYSNPLDQLQTSGWGECCGRATFQKFVPDITKVPVNRVTMTINSFLFTRFGDNASFGGSHTIRLYGVPEPASGTLLLILALVMIRRRNR